MVEFLVSQIIIGKLNYVSIARRYPELKDDIDNSLRSMGREDLIVDNII